MLLRQQHRNKMRNAAAIYHQRCPAAAAAAAVAAAVAAAPVRLWCSPQTQQPLRRHLFLSAVCYIEFKKYYITVLNYVVLPADHKAFNK